MISSHIVESLKGIEVSRPPKTFQIDYLVARAVIAEMVATQLVTEDGVKEACRRVENDLANFAREGRYFAEVVVFTYARTVAARIGGEVPHWLGQRSGDGPQAV